MTKEEHEVIMKSKTDTIKWLRDVMGMPTEMQPKEICPKCNVGIVFGIKDDPDSPIRYLRSGETNQPIKICAECNLELQDRIDKAKILSAAARYTDYLEKIDKLGLRYGAKIPKEQPKNRGKF